MNELTKMVVSVYKAMLRLYPCGFQDEYGEEMMAVFRKSCEASNSISKLEIIQLGLREIRDLPANLIREYISKIGEEIMNARMNWGEPLYKSLLRGAISFGAAFALVYLIFCSVDTLFNAGNTTGHGNTIMHHLFVQPTAIALGLGVAFWGFRVTRVKVWVAAVASLLAFTLVYRIFVTSLISASEPIHPTLWMIIYPYLFETVAGIVVGGVMGYFQNGWRKVGWYILAGVISFNLGWVLMDISSQYLVRQSPFFSDITYMVVGNPWYFLYFLIPTTLFGVVVGIGVGITTAGVNRKPFVAG